MYTVHSTGPWWWCHWWPWCAVVAAMVVQPLAVVVVARPLVVVGALLVVLRVPCGGASGPRAASIFLSSLELSCIYIWHGRSSRLHGHYAIPA